MSVALKLHQRYRICPFLWALILKTFLEELKMLKNLKLITLLLTLVLCFAFNAFAQEQYGNIEGTVKDPQGAVVPNVSVTITNPASGFKRATNTDGNGFFSVLQLPPGNYTVMADASSGFNGAKRENVVVKLGLTATSDFTLALKSADGNVVISVTDTEPIDTGGTQTQTNLSSKQIELLPKGTTFTSVLKAVPGTRNEGGSGGFQVDGASGSENSFVIDGQEVNNFRTGALRGNQNLPTQFVEEVSLKSSGFAAEFGGATGGVVNVVTKGGNNTFHGEFGSMFTSNKLEGANRPTLNRFTGGSAGTFVQKSEYITLPKIQGNAFLPTANLSGPIIKNRLWFFGSYTPQIIHQEANTAFFTTGLQTAFGAIPARTYRFNERNERDTRNEYAFGRLDASPFDSLRLSGTYTWNPVSTRGALPFNSISIGGTPSTVNFGGTIGSLTGNELTKRQGGRETANNVTGQAVWTPSSNFILTGRYSRGFTNEKAGNYFAVFQTQYLCPAGSATIVGACSTGVNDATNGATIRDVALRTNYQGDATYIAGNFGGRHEFKGGYVWLRLLNDVLNGYATLGRISLNYNGTSITDLGSLAAPTPGFIGAGTLTRIGTKGTGANTSQSIFVQDKWEPVKRLTFNLGVRFEKEDLPSFNGFAPPINFKWFDKVVPRLGVAYALTNDGKTVLRGSYSQFSDRVRFDLPRGSFGGDFFRTDYFEIFPTSGPFRTQFTLASILGAFNDAPGGRCPTSGFIATGALSRCQADFRIASNNPNATLLDGKVDPNLKPFRQSEITFGLQRQLTNTYRLSGRYVYKNVLSAVEDAGVRNAAGSEAYILGNPGTGLHLEQLKALGYLKSTTPQRRYNALEVVLDKNLSNHYYYSLNYTYSRLYGNYSGLASSDEITAGTGIGRTSPGVNRFFDLPHLGFTATGEKDNGLLATDRPHVFNALGAYIFDWFGDKNNETTASFFTTFESGTPVTSTVGFYTTSIFTKRGDLGRTPFFTQTDLSFSHKYKFGSDNKYSIAFDFNLLNAFDQKQATGFNTSVSAVTLTEASLFNNGGTLRQICPASTVAVGVCAASPMPYVFGTLSGAGLTNSLDCPTPTISLAAGGPPPLACGNQTVLSGLGGTPITVGNQIFGSPSALTNAYNAGQILALINRYLDGTPGQTGIAGLTNYQVLPALNRRNSSYGLANTFQAPRAIRFGFRFQF
jgi:outer membrane receptor protein involved in Fe transport